MTDERLTDPTIPAEYVELLDHLKTEVRAARIRARRQVNTGLLELYWRIGNAIGVRVDNERWGAKVLDRLADDLRSEFPDMTGLSRSNLYYMRWFASAWPEVDDGQANDRASGSLPGGWRPSASEEDPIVQQPVGQLPTEGDGRPPGDVPEVATEPASTLSHSAQKVALTSADAIVPQLAGQLTAEREEPDSSRIAVLQSEVGQLPWGHIRVLLGSLDDRETRDWYAARAVAEGWSRAVLMDRIKGQLHLRVAAAPSNFPTILASDDSDLARQLVKDPYSFDFLGFSERVAERDLEDGLMIHLQRFLLELGQGFAFVGRQWHFEVDGDDFWIDLLFYNYLQNRFVVVELKVDKVPAGRHRPARHVRRLGGRQPPRARRPLPDHRHPELPAPVAFLDSSFLGIRSATGRSGHGCAPAETKGSSATPSVRQRLRWPSPASATTPYRASTRPRCRATANSSTPWSTPSSTDDA